MFSPSWPHNSTSDFLYKVPELRSAPQHQQAVIATAFSRVQDTIVKAFPRARASTMNFWKGHGEKKQRDTQAIAQTPARSSLTLGGSGCTHLTLEKGTEVTEVK